MGKKSKIYLAVAVLATVALAAGWYLSRHNVAVLEPAGTIAQKERNLIIFASLLAVIVVVPVFALAIGIAWRYREGNTKARHSPDWDHSRALELLWWAIPGAIILVLSIVTWRSSHDLDPYKPLAASGAKSVSIQVVALDWKWLFIYPEQGVASVNYTEIPVNTPVNFDITSDTVMNSFWIPNLGGQIYAMPGMDTQLHLMAYKDGSYPGSSANISGEGFAGMKFVAKAVDAGNFDNWVGVAKKAPTKLSMTAYNQLSRPSEYNSVAYYSSPANGLYNDIIMKYMPPGGRIPVIDGGHM